MSYINLGPTDGKYFYNVLFFDSITDGKYFIFIMCYFLQHKHCKFVSEVV